MNTIPEAVLAQCAELSTKDWANLTKHIKNPVRFKLPLAARGLPEILSTVYPGFDTAEASTLLRMGLSERPRCKCGNSLVYQIADYNYTQYCRSCRKINAIACSKAIVANGVHYDNIKRAMTALNMHRFDIRKKLLSSDSNWVFADKHTEQCNGLIESINPALLDRIILDEAKQNRVPMKVLMEKYGIKCYATLGLVYAYHGMDTAFAQVPSGTSDFLNNKEQFIAAFAASNSEELSVRWDCSPSTILQTAHKYGIDVSVRQQSAIERTVIQYITEIAPEAVVISRDYTAIGSELDIYVPSAKFAIEFDGLYYHSDQPPFTAPNKHLEKTIKCTERGITLLHFTDIGETKNKLDIVKSMVRHKLGKSIKISARKCKISAITTQMAREFSENTHISGHSNASVYLGLFHDSTLVMTMSFSRPRFSSESQWEIIRMSSKLDHTVMGGASKLLAHFRKFHTGSILTYANLRFGTGAGYVQLGFEFVRNTGAGYFYTDMQQIYSRHKFQKAVIAKICPNYDSALSEVVNAWNNGFKRYRDCGNAVFLLK